ncbi:MAG: hypothetical protein M3135_05405 [Actinomycetota bacterium]|nr:hypothetical protein [Actinomycetota bacterium]
MKRYLSAAMIVLTGTGVGLALAAEEDPAGPPAVWDPSVESQPEGRGVGERLILVVGGAFATREEATEAVQPFGELQGYYVARADQFVGLADAIGARASDFVLVSAFRTSQGAEEFASLARAAGDAAVVTPRLENLGSEYVGLGQEAHPDGSGPLTGPLPGVSVP